MHIDRVNACLRSRRVRLVVGLAAAIVLIGCGRPLPPVAPVSGFVTMNGKPVTTGMVMFHPEKGRAAIGPIGTDGCYSLTTFRSGDGALLGPHRVTIDARTVAGGPSKPLPMTLEEEMKQGTNLYPADPGITWIVPEKYALSETSPLTADVKPGSNTIDFAVP